MQYDPTQFQIEVGVGHTVVAASLANLLIAKGLFTLEEIQQAANSCLAGALQSGGGPMTEVVVRSFLSGLRKP